MTSHEIVEKSWDLSLYELHRTPQEAITDDTEIAVSARSLQSELTCPICLDMLTSTMTTKECLHRFCAECIVTALRSGNKECPTCRKKLVSKRSLRPDPNFDMLVEKIFPNREEYEAQQESILETVTRSHSQNFITSIKDGIQAQMAHAKAVNRKKNFEDVVDSPRHLPIGGERPQDRDENYEESAVLPPKKKKKIRPPVSLNVAVGSEDSSSEQAGTSAQEVEIVFKLHPDMISDPEQREVVELMKDNLTRFIKTTTKALVEHLCKYLAMRIALDLANKKLSSVDSVIASTSSGSGSSSSVKDLTIYIASAPGGFLCPMGTSLSLLQVNETYWKQNKPMEMFYSFKRQ